MPEKCPSKIPSPNWSGFKPHLMRASRPHVNAIWRSGYYSIPFEPNEQGGPLPVPQNIHPFPGEGTGKDQSIQEGTGDTVTAVFQVTHLQLWMTASPSRVPALPTGHATHECSVGKSADNPIQIHDEPSFQAEGGSFNSENGVETEVSSFSFQLKTPKGIRPAVHDELILRGLGSPLKECRDAANELFMMKQSHRSYTKNQLKRRENKFLDIFRHGKELPYPSGSGERSFLSLQAFERCS